jgi:hypothetical protein
MRPGYSLLANKETRPTDSEQSIIQSVIRDYHVLSISEWLINQKPKIRSKFMKFLETVQNSPPQYQLSNFCSDLAERFARDITQPEYHSVLRLIIDNSDGEFSDVLHLLSIHMQRTNVMASIPAVRDSMPQLFKAIAQEDHIYSRPYVARHELPRVTTAQAILRGRMVDPLPSLGPTRSFKPTGKQRSRPFAVFPNGQIMQSMSRSQFVNYNVIGRQQQSGIYNVVNAPTCL